MINDFLLNDGKQVSLYSNMILFRDCNNVFILDGDLLEVTPQTTISMMTILTNNIAN